MVALPPSIRDPRKTDADHLKLLAVFHFVVACLAFLGIGFLLLHYTMMSHIMFNPKIWEGQKGGPPPQEFFAFFKWFYLIFGALLVLGSVCNLLSGLWINARRNRMFSLVVGAINCFQVPVGTVLGIFTIIILMCGDGDNRRLKNHFPITSRFRVRFWAIFCVSSLSL